MSKANKVLDLDEILTSIEIDGRYLEDILGTEATLEYVDEAKAQLESWGREQRIEELERLDLGINIMPQVIEERLSALRKGEL